MPHTYTTELDIERYLIEEIYNCRSFYYIDMIIEKMIDDSDMANIAPLLTEMQQLKTLDEIHLLAAEALGMDEKAAEIRAFIASKNNTHSYIKHLLT